MVDRRVYLGIDGGATKTAGVLVSDSGTILAECLGRGSAFVGVPSDEVIGVLVWCIDELCRQAGIAKKDIAFAGMGLNGIDFADECDAQAASLARGCDLHRERLAVVNDGIVALWAATSNPAAVAVQHGSGLTCAYRSAHAKEQLFDSLDVGRIFNLRAEAIVTVARMIDGRAPPTRLREAVLAHLGIDQPEEFAERVYRKRVPAAKLRTVHCVVYDAWERGDPAGAELIDKARADYARCAVTMVSRTGSDSAHVAFGGGVIACSPARFLTSLRDAVLVSCPRVTVKRPDLPPQHGAALMAAFHDGIDPVSAFERIRQRCASRGQSDAARGTAP